ncbi:MAG: S9 family peptidase [Deinococcales bacterium]
MPRRLTSEDLLRLTFVSDPRLTSDGRLGAAVVTRIVAGEEDTPPRYRSRVALFDLADGEERAFTSGPYADTAPRFAPDRTRLAFLRRETEKGKAQLSLMPLGGGEAEVVTDFASGVSGYCWHPDSRRLALTTRGDWKDDAAERGLPRRIARLRYKSNGQGFVPTEPSQLYLYSLRSGRARRLTDLPVSAAAPAFSPDGTTLYFVSAEDVERDDDWRGGLYALDLKSRALRLVVGDLLTPGAPVPSPDGRLLAYLAPSVPEDIGSPTGVWVVEAAGGRPRLLTGGLDATASVGGDSRYGAYPQDPVWDDNASLVFNLNREGASGLARVALEGGITPLMDGRRVVTSFDYAAGRAWTTVETPTEPGELLLREPGSQERKMSGYNDAWLEELQLKRPSDAVSLTSDDGHELSYWTLPPVRARRDRAVVAEVHGGPHTNYGYGFCFEFHLLSARGYTVVYGNPRGGSSYGPAFYQAVLGDYGGGDARDVLAIVEHAMERHREPGAPVHLTGGSYGGFMTNWLVGVTDRFRSAVTQRSICNWLSMYGTSDIGYRFVEREQGGTPWHDLARLWDQSPVKHVANVTTPTLVLHAEQDHRCPMEQAEQWFTALKRLGRADTELLRFPDESHELSRSGRPDRRIARLDAILDWFERHA